MRWPASILGSRSRASDVIALLEKLEKESSGPAGPNVGFLSHEVMYVLPRWLIIFPKRKRTRCIRLTGLCVMFTVDLPLRKRLWEF